MTTMGLMRSFAVLAVLGMPVGNAGAATLTADDAVKIALKSSTPVVNSEAAVLDARGGVHGARAGVLPRLSASFNRSGSFTENQPTSGARVVGGQIINVTGSNDIDSRSTSKSISGSWSVVDLSALKSLSSARTGLAASRKGLQATRNDVALETRRQFYEVVKAIRLAEVAAGALRLSRDDERRVRAMFEVGSVSKSDLLKAQVRTAQSELDSLTAINAVTVQRIVLANQLGVPASSLGEIDTVLSADRRDYDEATLLAEATQNRPDLQAAVLEERAARAGLAASRFSRLPSLNLSGSVTFDPRFTQKSTTDTLPGAPPVVSSFRSEDDREWRGQLAVNWTFFDGFATSGQIASSRARLIRAEETRKALQRNLASEVHQQLLAYTEAVEQNHVAQRGLESATENLKLTQEKYNVGSSTILELIDAQVQLQTAQSNVVRALAAIHVAEAQINRVRGQSQ